MDRDIERLNNKIIYPAQFKEKATLKNKQLKQLNKIKKQQKTFIRHAALITDNLWKSITSITQRS